ncbi:MAG: peptide MFS transporter [Verrucomicrobia bacterium]|nr:peptide MFS transporter [Verrucomicrobiota bacterium]
MSRHPKEMYFLSFIELCQRFALWGIGNLLVLFLVQKHQFSDESATHLYGLFTGVAFALPLLGGFIADRTSYRAGVIFGCILTAIGCLLLATGNTFLLYVALLSAALGASIFTPSVYTILGHLYQGQHDLQEGGFTIYYSAVNIGTFLATFILGALGHANLWAWAFIVAAAVQIVGLLVFLKIMKKPTFAQVHLRQRTTTVEKKTSLNNKEKQRIIVICILSLISILFWMSYNQGWSSMSIFALRFTDLQIGSFNMPASWLLSLESLYLVILAFPLAWLYRTLAKRKLDPSPSLKTVYSLVAMGLCFYLMQVGAKHIPEGAQEAAVSPFYLIGAYAFMALGEMLLAPIGLSMVTRLSPRRYTAFLVGAWYLCVGVAFYAGGLIAGLVATMELSRFFNIFVLVSWIPAILLFFGVKKLKKMSHTHSL